MKSKSPPKPTHVAGTSRGEEYVIRHGHEPGRAEPGKNGYRSSRDSTSVSTTSAPVDPRMPEMPPS